MAHLVLREGIEGHGRHVTIRAWSCYRAGPAYRSSWIPGMRELGQAAMRCPLLGRHALHAALYGDGHEREICGGFPAQAFYRAG